jgi:hypothetical protein
LAGVVEDPSEHKLTKQQLKAVKKIGDMHHMTDEMVIEATKKKKKRPAFEKHISRMLHANFK